VGRTDTVARPSNVAAGLLAALVSDRVPPQPNRSQTVGARAPQTPPIVRESPAVSEASQTDHASSQPHQAAIQSRRSPARRSHARVPESPWRDEPGMVLALDPVPDPSAMSIVHVRVSRAALVALGIAPAAPEGGGQVELEVLVGEDGVARSIRSAMPVAVRQE
jgi:hypothetical protein